MFMQKDYNELKKRGLKGTVAIGIAAATLLLMHSCLSNKEIEKHEELTNIGDKEKLAASDENLDSDVQGGIVKANNSDSEYSITEENTFKSNKLKEKTIIEIQGEKIGNIQTSKEKKKLENEEELKNIISKDNINKTKEVFVKEEKEMEKQEHNLLVFGSLNFGKINHTNAKDAGSTGPIKPNKPDIDNFKPLTPEVDPLRPIDNFKPLTPEVDPLRPIDNFKPLTPEVDPLRPIDNFKPLTPEVDPLRPIDNFKPLTPEIDPLRPIDNFKPLTPEVDPLRPIDNFKPLTPEVDPLRPIDNFKPLTPEVDPLRPIDNFKPLTPEVDPLRPIDNFKPLTPEVDPLRPIDNFKPLTPEVDPTEVIIWENENDIYGDEYTLKKNLEMIDGIDGLKTAGGTMINEATINSNASVGENYAMRAEDHADGRQGAGINKGNITGKTRGMLATNGGEIINEAGGIISNTGDYGMEIVDGSTGTNKGTISNDGRFGMSISGTGSTGVNEGTISNSGDYGLKISGSGTGINDSDGVIENNGNYGMYIENLGSNGINKGTILNHSDYGLYTHGNGATATNDGIISNDGDYGIWAGGYSSAVNNGTISNSGNYRMQAMSKSTAINNGNLDDGFDNYIVMRGGDQSNLINTGTIDMNYSHSTAMSGSAGGTVVNKGIININGDYGKGMYINGGGTATNEGTINLNASNGTGIYAEGSGTRVINTGTINLSGSSSDGGETDNKNNRSIFLYDGASLVNSGTFESDQNINFDEMGDGKFIMSSGGTVKADKIEGDIYASGALAMGGYDDVYSTYKMLETNELDGEIISNSAMFDAHFTENADENGFYDVILDRKDFNTLLSNKELGEILEDNYGDNGNELKEDYYDALKLVSTEKGLNKAVEDSYGMGYYPALAKQTFEVVKDSNQVITDNVINSERSRKIGETIAIAGGNATRLENDSHDNVSGYDTDLYSVYLGGEKQVSEDLRIGGIVTIGKGDTNFNDIDGSREDYYYQGNIYFTYENEDRLKFTSMVFGGMTDTSLERTLAFGSLCETLTDDINNYYAGINSELSKKYYFGQNYLEPKFELNFIYMMQDDVSESGDQGLEVDGVNSVSAEAGLGVGLGRDFYFESGSKINLEGSVTGYAELGDPYKDLDSTFSTLSDDKVNIDGYNSDDFYGDIMIGGSYETKNSLKLYTKIGYRIGNNSEGFIENIGLSYLF